MKSGLFLPILALVLGACTAGPATAVPHPTDTPATQVVSVTDTPRTTDTVTPIPPALPGVTFPALIHIDFQDANHGWGIAVNDNGYILRTVDGGTTWLNATPPNLGSIGSSASLYVLNVNTVWVLVPGPDYFTANLYHTRDGGATWTSNPVPFGDAHLQFLDASIGRALADRGALAGSQAVELYKTSDGGATWTSAFHNDASQPGSSDSLPLSGIKNGLTFLDANTGWVTGSIAEAGNVFLYATHDGGISWAQQGLSLPIGYEAYRYIPQAPIFFGQDGYLPLTIYESGMTTLTFYVTHDGGATWTGDPTDAARVIMPGYFAFADILHAWSWDGGTTLYSTGDGAQIWNVLPTGLDLSGKLHQVEFVPAGSNRFVGWALTIVDETNHSQLYKTKDNGATWTPVIP
jgi:photosystem II stability/assembly factor-like uncharacterized protein